MYKMILITCFSLLLLTGCRSTDAFANSWILPDKPVLEQPEFEKEGDRLYLNKENSVLLRNNLLELKAYHEKLELLIDEMLSHYVK